MHEESKGQVGQVEAGAERGAGCSLDRESVNGAVSPLCEVESVNLLADETDSVGFRSSVLIVPAVVRLLSEGDELLACGDRKDVRVLVRVVSEFDMALPVRKLRPTKRKCKPDNVGDHEL